jgi:hypothetical protein
MVSELRTVAVTTKEGGDWHEFLTFKGGAVHAIKFSDGKIWDPINGFRKETLPNGK